MRINNKSAGFTLIELLIVLAILSIAISGVIVAVGDFGQSRQMEIEAQIFKNKLVYASQRAILMGQTLSVSVNENGYSFYLLQGDQWLSLKEKIFTHHAWHGKITADHVLEIILTSSGDYSSFSFMLSINNRSQCRIVGNEVGEITIL